MHAADAERASARFVGADDLRRWCEKGVGGEEVWGWGHENRGIHCAYCCQSVLPVCTKERVHVIMAHNHSLYARSPHGANQTKTPTETVSSLIASQ